MKIEPKLHFALGELPKEHPNAFENINCKSCNEPAHAFNNKIMQPWVETGKGNYCLTCFNIYAINCGYPEDQEFLLEI